MKSKSWVTQCPENIRRVETDAMPPEVAIEMLCAPKARMTNRERKECLRALSKVFESTLEAITHESRMGLRMRSATWSQLLKWKARADKCLRQNAARADKTAAKRDKVLTIPADTEEKNKEAVTKLFALFRAKFEQALSALDTQAAQIRTLQDLISDEQTRRQDFIAKLHEVVPSVSEALEAHLCSNK
jgi:hypothetical protein